MRIALAVPLVVALAACQVSKGNNEVSVSYNQDLAENTAADVGNTAENIAADIGNDVKNTGEKIQNEVGDNDDQSNATENKSK